MIARSTVVASQRYVALGDSYTIGTATRTEAERWPDQLVDRLGPKSVAHFGTMEPDPNRALVDRPVVGDVLELEAVHRPPTGRVEQLGHLVLV